VEFLSTGEVFFASRMRGFEKTKRERSWPTRERRKLRKPSRMSWCVCFVGSRLAVMVTRRWQILVVVLLLGVEGANG